MISSWHRLLALFNRKVWLRITLFGLAGVLTAVAGIFLAPFVPEAWTFSIGAKAIDSILNVLASSMLAVTVFSVSTIIGAYGSAGSNVTPRAISLLVEDTTSNNVVGTFIGSFLFSLVGIIALSTGFYDDQGRAILLVATTGLIVLIAVTILRWVDYLTHFGRLGETIGRVEKASWTAMEGRLKEPYLGGQQLADLKDIPEHALPIFSPEIGYVQHIDMAALEKHAKDAETKIYVTALPGTFADPARPVAMVAKADADDIRENIAKAFTVGTGRTFDQDPRFGLCVLSEIASRALSPAVNDPGTAIDVIGRLVRLLTRWARFERTEEQGKVEYPHIWVPAIVAEDMFDDAFSAVARDGASLIEIHLRLQRAFLALAEGGDRSFTLPVKQHSKSALARAEAELILDSEKEAVRAAAAQVKQRLS